MIRFLIISPVLHKKEQSQYGGYTPYIREMNIWLRHVDQVRVIAPVSSIPPDALESMYQHPHMEVVEVPFIEFKGFRKSLESAWKLPLIVWRILSGMIWASHIHLRCPSNMGLLGTFAQIFFPAKKKTVKYANNWDWNSRQPFSYRLQQRILRHTVLTHNTSVLVYGDWKERSKNIVPFFTATYSRDHRLPAPIRDLIANQPIRLIYVGTLTSNKRPLECLRSLQSLKNLGYSVVLDMFGDGSQRPELEAYMEAHHLTREVKLWGKQSPETVEAYFRKAHFLVFLSRSEGWPKVVAEAMWWGCLPITTDVSCVSQMVDVNRRGVIVLPTAEEVKEAIIQLVNRPERYQEMCREAMDWSREYHLERFEAEIVKLLEAK
ncbi:glycosyltransferase family 4 protein [Geofilum rubicundum]|uniref:Glycosyltransferase, group 1 n=1 Tax=Geofilum rubicundum JCM 15548 TaxID=1236989 RepID=A0A0E9LTA6_9BACT|nr:glycosyltransferase [Geofilum rubicundum]GAO28523.1 glycosyltransferase, group 1 [Geofilum rubicundum JCM 15548]